ncbi:MAG: outer membrane lipoprotein carrier protein LolA [Flavobacteriales bacterium]|nr:outer membrane lipoprotein carrier protein LolA [Flavobacteriales bacterium]MBK9195683.1 outer membrane lipoprotein carrier protein LolA [Flavobacteriales bacterium]MBP6573626.1 outer membrane lipoprotein carrier protein LolA [Flavobacteriales bacterium]
MNITLLPICGAIAFTTFLGTAWAPQETRTPIKADHELVVRMKAVAKSARTIQCTLTQEKHVHYLKEPQISPGTFAYERPGKFRWELNGAQPTTILTVDGNVRVKENGKEKVLGEVDRKIYAGVNDMVMKIMDGEHTLGDGAKPKYFIENGDLLVLIMPTASRLGKRFKQMELRFAKANLHLYAMTTVEADGDLTVVKFSTPVLDQPVPVEVFSKL